MTFQFDKFASLVSTGSLILPQNRKKKPPKQTNLISNRKIFSKLGRVFFFITFCRTEIEPRAQQSSALPNTFIPYFYLFLTHEIFLRVAYFMSQSSRIKIKVPFGFIKAKEIEFISKILCSVFTFTVHSVCVITRCQ